MKNKILFKIILLLINYNMLEAIELPTKYPTKINSLVEPKEGEIAIENGWHTLVEKTGIFNFQNNNSKGIELKNDSTIPKVYGKNLGNFIFGNNSSNNIGISSNSDILFYNYSNISIGGISNIGMMANGINSYVGNDTDGTNIGKITINNGSNSIGMKALNGGVAQNNSSIEINASNSIGISSNGDGSIALNSGGIALKVDDATGIFVENRANGINEGTIDVTAMNSKGIKTLGNGSVGKNNGTISVSGIDSVGILVESSALGENNGLINLTGSNSKGIKALGIGSSAKNSGTIKVNAVDSTGIYIENGATGLNSGLLEVQASNSYGIKVLGLSTIAENTGTIKVNSLNSKGIHIENEASGINSGTIDLNNSISKSTNGNFMGIYGNNANQVKNIGNININISNSYGVKLDSGSNLYSNHLYNSGKIKVSGDNSLAIALDDGPAVLEFGNGTEIVGITTADRMDLSTQKISDVDKLLSSLGDDQLIVNGNVNVGDVYNFEKLIANSDTVLLGTVNLDVSDKSDYILNAFSDKKYAWNDSRKVMGKLDVQGQINVDVDYSDMTINGTDKTGKIIAKEIITSNAGSIVLKKQNEVSQESSITETYYKKYGAKSFMIDKVGIVSGTGPIRRDFFTLVDGETSAGKDWKTYSIAVFNPEYGGTYLGQYYEHIDDKNPIFPRDKVILPQNEQILSNMFDFNNQIISKLDNYSETGSNSYFECGYSNSNYIKKIIELKTEGYDSANCQLSYNNEKSIDVDYIGNYGNFDSQSKNNYSYNAISNGFLLSYIQRYRNNAYGIFNGSYLNTQIEYEGLFDYENTDSDHTESINSLNIGYAYRRYDNIKIWKYDEITDIETTLGGTYQFSTHDLNTSFVGEGKIVGDYNSSTFNIFGQVAKEYYLLRNNLTVKPYGMFSVAGVSNGERKYDNGVDFASTFEVGPFIEMGAFNS